MSENHGLYQEVVRTNIEPIVIESDGSTRYDETRKEEIEQVDYDRKKTIHCYCGESWYKSEKAKEHIKEVEG